MKRNLRIMAIESKNSIDNQKILSVCNVSKQVKLADKSLTILHGINFEVNKGETVAIIGASGSGKTSLLSLLAGLDVPSLGEIYLANQPIHLFSEEQRSQIRAEHVGFVFQQFLLIESLTALENIMVPAELAQTKNAKALALKLLADVGLSERAEHFPNQLSGGEQQRVAIARAFITQPEILFADEPTGNLDTKTGEHIIDLLFDLNERQGTTLILVTHDHKLAQRCQRNIEMDSGKLIFDQQLTIAKNSTQGG
jgi:putative ABC transport system ATP-binding protein